MDFNGAVERDARINIVETAPWLLPTQRNAADIPWPSISL
jgi:hypothetical protein